MIYLANYRLIIPTLLIFYILLAPSLAFQQIDQQPISPHTLRIAGDYNSPPDAFIDEKGQFTGFDIDIAKAIAHNAGMNIQFIPEAWPQAREELLHGKIDAVLGTYAIPELEKVLDYSIPYCIIQPTVFMWGRKTFDSTDSLAKKTIIVQRNTPTADILRIKFPSTRIIEINSVPNAFKLLSEKIYYCAIVDRQQGYYVVTKNHLKNINAFDSPILRLKSCFAVHEGDNNTLNIFNEGIMLLKETGEYQRIFSHWFGNIPQEKPSLNLLLVHIAFLSLILILILLWFWTLRRTIVNRTRSLNSELEHRKIIEDAHRESEEKYRTLVEQLPMITYVMEINPPMRFVFISPQIKDILGIAPEELLNDSKRFLELVHEDDIDMVQTNIERLKDKNAPPWAMDFRIKNTQGQLFWVHVQGRIICAADGQPVYQQGVMLDITKQIETESALHLSWNYLQSLLETSLEGVAILDTNGRIAYANQRWAEMLQLPIDKLLDRPYYDFLHPDELPYVNYHQNRRHQGIADQYDLRFLRKDGSDMWTITATSPIMDNAGEFIGSIGMFTDITYRKQYESALQESEAKFRTVIECAPMGVILANGIARDSIEINKRLTEITGYTQEEMRSLGVLAFTHSEDRRRLQNLLTQLEQGHIVNHESELRLIRKDGHIVWTHVRISVITCSSMKPYLCICLINDITERKEREEETFRHQQQLRALASELSLVEERERHQLASALHDSICQTLAFANIRLGILSKKIELTQYQSTINEIRNIIEETVEQARTLTFELSPPILYEIGFEAAIDWLAENFQRHYGLHITTKLPKERTMMSIPLRGLLYQSVRELLINVVKHANASNVIIDIQHQENHISITVADDGDGVNLKELNSTPEKCNGFGLFNIRERLGLLNGILEIKSKPGTGMVAKVVMPFEQLQSQDQELS